MPRCGKWVLPAVGGAAFAAAGLYYFLSKESRPKDKTPRQPPQPKLAGHASEEDFAAAAGFIATVEDVKPTTADSLELYKYFKQATEGPCTIPKPSMLDFRATAKWDAWTSAGDMGAGEARDAYIGVVERLVPSWRERCNAPSAPAHVSAEEFAAAAAFMRTTEDVKPTTADSLELYKYFKQATEGPCTISKPSMLDFRATAKWDAWTSAGDMDAGEARDAYIGVVERLEPSWRERCNVSRVGPGGVAANPGAGAPPRTKPKSGGSMAPRVSTMTVQDDDPDDAKDDMFWYAANGDLEDVQRLLSQGAAVDSLSDTGETALHLAADSGRVEMVRVLLDAGANPNVHETEMGQTPLMYAVQSESKAVVAMLIERGADVHAVDSEDVPVMELLDGIDEGIVALIEEAAKPKP